MNLLIFFHSDLDIVDLHRRLWDFTILSVARVKWLLHWRRLVYVTLRGKRLVVLCHNLLVLPSIRVNLLHNLMSDVILNCSFDVRAFGNEQLLRSCLKIDPLIRGSRLIDTILLACENVRSLIIVISVILRLSILLQYGIPVVSHVCLLLCDLNRWLFFRAVLLSTSHRRALRHLARTVHFLLVSVVTMNLPTSAMIKASGL